MDIDHQDDGLIGFEGRPVDQPGFHIDLFVLDAESKIVVILEFILPFRSLFTNFIDHSAAIDKLEHQSTEIFKWNSEFVSNPEERHLGQFELDKSSKSPVGQRVFVCAEPFGFFQWSHSRIFLAPAGTLVFM